MHADLEQWQLRGSSAELYERHLVLVVTQQWAVDLVSRARLRHGERVLDVACGTGIVARVAAGHVGSAGRVVGLDLNPTMLAVARTFAEVDGVPIEWCEGSATALPFDDTAFDVVLCQFGLQFFPDRLAALQEMRRMLASGGRLGASVFAEIAQNPAASALSDSLDRHLGAGSSSAKRNEHALADLDGLRSLFDAAGFTDIRTETIAKTSRYTSVDDFVRFQFAATPLASVLAPLGASERDSLVTCVIKDLRAKLAAFLGEREFAFPQVAHVALATP